MSGRKTEEPGTSAAKRRKTPIWLRKPGRWISQNGIFAAVVAWIAVRYLKFVFRTNSWVVEPEDILDQVTPELPVVVSVWHGQHVLLPAIPIGLSGAVMISRSLDGEITARVAEAFGAKTIRASGGRNPRHTLSKGALRGFLEMLATLKGGESVLQTADIPKGTPRRAGQGIIALAQKSGRPIVPLAVASSRRWVLPKSWDRTTINLPFGKSAIVAGERIWVAADAGPDGLEAARRIRQLEAERNLKRTPIIAATAPGLRPCQASAIAGQRMSSSIRSWAAIGAAKAISRKSLCAGPFSSGTMATSAMPASRSFDRVSASSETSEASQTSPGFALCRCDPRTTPAMDRIGRAKSLPDDGSSRAADRVWQLPRLWRTCRTDFALTSVRNSSNARSMSSREPMDFCQCSANPID